MCLHVNNLLHKKYIFVSHDIPNFKKLFLEIFQNEQFIFINRFPRLRRCAASVQSAKQFDFHKNRESNQFFNVDDKCGTGVWQSREKLYLYASTIYKHFVIKQFQIVKHDSNHFLLIKRSRTRQLHPNVENIINIFCLDQNINFQAIYLEKLSYREQIMLFYNAKYIFGAHGAGLFNIIFCNKDVKIFEMIPYTKSSLQYDAGALNVFKHIGNKMDLEYVTILTNKYNYSIWAFTALGIITFFSMIIPNILLLLFQKKAFLVLFCLQYYILKNNLIQNKRFFGLMPSKFLCFKKILQDMYSYKLILCMCDINILDLKKRLMQVTHQTY